MEISSKEKEIELTVGRMEGQEEPGMPGMDVYSRDEMERMKQAMDEGDYDTLRGLDGNVADMDDETLESMRQFQRRQEDAGPPSGDRDEEEKGESRSTAPKANKEGTAAETSSSFLDKVKSFFGF